MTEQVEEFCGWIFHPSISSPGSWRGSLWHHCGYRRINRGFNHEVWGWLSLGQQSTDKGSCRDEIKRREVSGTAPDTDSGYSGSGNGHLGSSSGLVSPTFYLLPRPTATTLLLIHLEKKKSSHEKPHVCILFSFFF